MKNLLRKSVCILAISIGLALPPSLRGDDFHSVCDRSQSLRYSLSWWFEKHCSTITAEDLSHVTSLRLMGVSQSLHESGAFSNSLMPGDLLNIDNLVHIDFDCETCTKDGGPDIPPNYLAGLKKLETVNYYWAGYGIGENDFSLNRSLRTILIRHFFPPEPSNVKGLESLKRLDLIVKSHSKVTQKVFNTFHSLEELNLQSSNIAPEVELPHPEKVRKLAIKSNIQNWNGSTFPQLKQFTSLETLSIDNNEISGTSDLVLSPATIELPQLSAFTFNGTSGTRSIRLKQLPKLASLEITFEESAEERSIELDSLPVLASVSIKAKNAHLVLRNLPAIDETLSLGGTSAIILEHLGITNLILKDAGLKSLNWNDLDELREVDLSNNKLVVLGDLAQKMVAQKHLEKVNLCGNPFTEEEFLRLVRLFPSAGKPVVSISLPSGKCHPLSSTVK